jgi:tRNA U34 5-methylaminomethyl-2-thiouridine-forming methyltransferase MnmC
MIMERKIITTSDGSKTIHLPAWNESYHSKHGALQEALHVFIHSGLHIIKLSHIHVLEVGFGSGLNAILTLMAAEQRNTSICYTGLEAFPLSEEEFNALNYQALELISPYSIQLQEIFEAPWEKEVRIKPNFLLEKKEVLLEEFIPVENSFDLVYFDAFGPRVQPDLWSFEILSNIHKALTKNGVFVTYCAKGQVRRDLISLGFEVEKIPGPPGKREMLRAIKR